MDKKRIEQAVLRAQKFESIGMLAGGIAHDFNNILTAISGNISLAKMYVTPGEKAYEKLKEAEKSIVRANKLTRQLHTFSKGEDPVKKICRIGEMIRDSASFSLRGSNVRFEESIPDDLLSVHVDEGLIKQVISNIIINADQAMPDGGTIVVSAENATVRADDNLHLKSGQYIKISIKDEGFGISETELSKIFDPYFSTKKTGKGLGLATAFAIVNDHEGSIYVESEPGVGTTFLIYLPASEKKEEPRHFGKEKLPSTMGKVLIMDDEKDIRELTGEMLAAIGYEVGFATDGMEAVESYKTAKRAQNPYDLIIVDLTVPGGMGGKEAIQRVREIDPEVKAIVSSGYPDDPVMIDYEKFGFRDVIAKPYKINELSEKIHKTIAGTAA
ncbi:MAG: ATP-binding protein [Desulfatiglans sp.]|jgi:CheY-like chemotaxis protein/anti-sigma regulatory factor (Ser/Thr protein kinase)|nr:ATP-binding protein [Thermodesulfobacteriota bacterium]MEE4351441.1 ATP-binding protein [Desulfatiglans sp.]